MWIIPQPIQAQKNVLPAPEEIQAQVLEVWRQHEEGIRKTPDVLGATVSPATGEILIESDRPENLPTEIGGVSIKVLPPPPVSSPPPGVIVLRSGGVIERREDLDACPEEFTEVSRYRWRFCQSSVNNPEPIPTYLMAPPIAGIPYVKAEEIVKRNLERLSALPGVNGIGLVADGIEIITDVPEAVPSEVEGLPVKVRPPVVYENQSHSFNSPIDPLHGGVALGDPSWGRLMQQQALGSYYPRENRG